MYVMISRFTQTFLRRNVEKFMPLSFPNILYYFINPPAALFVLLFGTMPTAAAKAVMLSLYLIFSRNKRLSDSFTSKDISIKMLTKYLCGFIVNFIFGIDHDDIFDPEFEEYLAHFFGETRVDENDIRQKLFQSTQNLPKILRF
jgi:hypothetical protein